MKEPQKDGVRSVIFRGDGKAVMNVVFKGAPRPVITSKARAREAVETLKIPFYQEWHP